MKIIVDKEAQPLIDELVDSTMKLKGISSMPLLDKVRNCIMVVNEIGDLEKKEPEKEKPKKELKKT